MFGIFRFILSLMVVVTHLGGNEISNWAGSYAVFSFYTISGYLMTLVLSESYGFSLSGLSKFLINRFLRIYPIYYAVMLIAIPIIYFFPDVALSINPALRIPGNPMEWLHNLLIFGLMNDTSRIIPPAWSLYVELFFYICIALFFARNSKWTYIWFVVSIFYTIYLILTNATFGERYYTFTAASLPFSTGAVIYFFQKRHSIRSIKLIAIAGTLFLLNLIFTPWLYGKNGSFTYGFYINYILACFLIISLSNHKHSLSSMKFIDKLSGDLAYPIFLCHYHVATIVSKITGLGIGYKLVLLGSIFTLISAFVIHQTIDIWINKVRDKIKNKNVSPTFH